MENGENFDCLEDSGHDRITSCKNKEKNFFTSNDFFKGVDRSLFLSETKGAFSALHCDENMIRDLDDSDLRDIGDYGELFSPEINLFSCAPQCLTNEDPSVIIDQTSDMNETIIARHSPDRSMAIAVDIPVKFTDSREPSAMMPNTYEDSVGSSKPDFMKGDRCSVRDIRPEAATNFNPNAIGLSDKSETCSPWTVQGRCHYELFSLSSDIPLRNTDFEISKKGNRSKKRTANDREKSRTHNVNAAFQKLRMLIPTDPVNRKLSKVETLRLAISYINHLGMTLHSDDWEEQPCLKGKSKFEQDYSSTLEGAVCTFCMGKSKAGVRN